MDYNNVKNYNLTREVVLVTTKDRLQIPTVRDFFELVYNFATQKQEKNLENI